jgi:hypothetical protein
VTSGPYGGGLPRHKAGCAFPADTTPLAGGPGPRCPLRRQQPRLPQPRQTTPPHAHRPADLKTAGRWVICRVRTGHVVRARSRRDFQAGRSARRVSVGTVRHM